MDRIAHFLCKAALLGVSLLALHAAAARADDVIKYRRADGSIGFAQERSMVPKGAQILPAGNAGDGGKVTVVQSGPPTQPRPEHRQKSPDDFPQATESVEDRYRAQSEKLREQAEQAKREAENPGIPCVDLGWTGHGSRFRQRWDCSERDAAVERARETVRQSELKREALIDACMADDECEPRLIMD
jgi:hypothetical protein